MRATRFLVAIISALFTYDFIGFAEAADRWDSRLGFAAYRLQENDKYTPIAGEELQKSHGIRVTFLGTTTLLFDDGKTQLLIDGFLTRPSIWEVVSIGGVKTRPKVVQAVLKHAGANRIKGVFVSHSHYDHALDVAYIVRNQVRSQLYGSASTRMIGRGAGLTDCIGDAVTNCQIRVFKADQEYPVGEFGVKVISSKHSPATLLNNDIGDVITKELHQPTSILSYAEGGSFDFLIRHRGHSVLVKASANILEGALDNQKAEVLFLGVGRLGKQSHQFQKAFFEGTIGLLRPELVVPIHWDNLFAPVSNNLRLPSKVIDDPAAAVNFLIRQIDEMNLLHINDARPTTLRLLQGFQSVVLFREN